MMEDCIFCKISKGEAKSWKTYEDKNVMAFLSLNPSNDGHTLIAPKKHYEDIYDIPENELKKIISVAKRLSQRYKEKLNVKELNLLHASGKNAQQSVFHFHLHLVPRNKDDGIDLWHKDREKIKLDFDEILEKLK